MNPYFNYYTIMKKIKDKKFLRLQMIEHYKKTHNISLTVKLFSASRKTVYKWLKRYEKFGFVGLDDYSKRPKNSPNATPLELKQKVIETKKKYKS